LPKQLDRREHSEYDVLGESLTAAETIPWPNRALASSCAIRHPIEPCRGIFCPRQTISLFRAPTTAHQDFPHCHLVPLDGASCTAHHSRSTSIIPHLDGIASLKPRDRHPNRPVAVSAGIRFLAVFQWRIFFAAS
jgi:hypothetical protein